MFDERQEMISRSEIAQAGEQKDTPKLRRLLREVSFYSQPAAAMALAHLGATDALPELRRLHETYGHDGCPAAGEFGIAVMLLESPDRTEQKKRLLAAATSERGMLAFPDVVRQAAARELAKFGGDDVAKQLAKVNTYGAQYTALLLRTQSLPIAQQIEIRIAQLAAHDTPQKAGAAEDLLREMGTPALQPVTALRERVLQKIAAGQGRSVDGTAAGRCSSIIGKLTEAAR